MSSRSSVTHTPCSVRQVYVPEQTLGLDYGILGNSARYFCGQYKVSKVKSFAFRHKPNISAR